MPKKSKDPKESKLCFGLGLAKSVLLAIILAFSYACGLFGGGRLFSNPTNVTIKTSLNETDIQRVEKHPCQKLNSIGSCAQQIFAFYTNSQKSVSLMSKISQIEDFANFDIMELNASHVLDSVFDTSSSTRVLLTDFSYSIEYSIVNAIYDEAVQSIFMKKMALMRKKLLSIESATHNSFMLIYSSNEMSTDHQWICSFLTSYMNLYGTAAGADSMPLILFDTYYQTLERRSLIDMKQRFNFYTCDVEKSSPDWETIENSVQSAAAAQSAARNDVFPVAARTGPVAGETCDCPNSDIDVNSKEIQVINLGLHKSGTTTLQRMFTCMGLKSAHWLISGPKKNDKVKKPWILVARELCVKNVTGCASLKDGLQPVIDEGFNAIAQIDHQGIYPQIEHLEEIVESNPDAYYTLSCRNFSDQVQSIKAWHNMYPAISRYAVDDEVPMFPDGNPDPNDQDFELWLSRYHFRVVKYFLHHPQYKFALFDIELEQEQLLRQMTTFFNCNDLQITHSNKRRVPKNETAA